MAVGEAEVARPLWRVAGLSSGLPVVEPISQYGSLGERSSQMMIFEALLWMALIRMPVLAMALV